MGIVNKIVGGFINIFVLAWDFGIAILNLLTPSLKPGHVVPAHAPGHNLTWPEYVPPQDGDSRSACPMLNAMANQYVKLCPCSHGILGDELFGSHLREFSSRTT